MTEPEKPVRAPDLTDQIDVVALAREIAARLSPDALLDAEDVGALLHCTPRYVTENFVPAVGFPKPVRLTGVGGRRGLPRWIRADIIAWVAKHRNGASTKGGRPRNRPDEGASPLVAM